jgi:hypothetical protein
MQKVGDKASCQIVFLPRVDLGQNGTGGSNWSSPLRLRWVCHGLSGASMAQWDILGEIWKEPGIDGGLAGRVRVWCSNGENTRGIIYPCNHCKINFNTFFGLPSDSLIDSSLPGCVSPDLPSLQSFGRVYLIGFSSYSDLDTWIRGLKEENIKSCMGALHCS